MDVNGFILTTRRHDTIAEDSETGERIGSFDYTAGTHRGVIRGRVVAHTFYEWIQELESL